MGKLSLFVVGLALLFIRCATIPPEYLAAMEKEREGIALLNKRHLQTVNDLVDNWYNDRLNRLSAVKQSEIEKISFTTNDPATGKSISVIKSEQLKKIEDLYKQAMDETNAIRQVLIDGYSDQENWAKLTKLNALNLDMAKSLTELKASQRKLYAELAGQNSVFPTDLLNAEAKKLLNKTKQ